MLHCNVVSRWLSPYPERICPLFECHSNALLLQSPLITSLQCSKWKFLHDDVIKWKHFPRNWPFVRGIHRSPVNSPHKGQWRGALMFLSRKSWGWWFETISCPLWRHCNGQPQITCLCRIKGTLASKQGLVTKHIVYTYTAHDKVHSTAITHDVINRSLTRHHWIPIRFLRWWRRQHVRYWFTGHSLTSFLQIVQKTVI